MTAVGLQQGASPPAAPALEGIHHLKLPVADLDRSQAWYQDRFGYEVMIDFVEDGVRMGVSMTHPNGGPDLALRYDPAKAADAAGFDYFAIGVPGREAIEALASRLSARGDTHDGVHRTPVGWVLLGLRDPDGHDVRFYTVPLELPAELAAHRHRDQPAEDVAESAESSSAELIGRERPDSTHGAELVQAPDPQPEERQSAAERDRSPA